VARTCRSAAVVGDDVVEKSLLDVGLDGDKVGSVVGAAADGRLSELHPAPIHDVARPNAIQARCEVIRTEASLHRR